jgi:cell wall-associated NlpC family hydrolase
MSRDRVVAEALAQVDEKAHYIKVGYGHMFNALGQRVDDVIRPAAVQLVVSGGRPPRVPGVPDYVSFAATSELHGRRVCAGRCGLVNQNRSLAGNPESPSDLAFPAQHVWRRPENYASATRQVLGECCIMRRHFDCLGFVIWCFWKAIGQPSGPAGFPHFTQQFTRPLDRRQVPPLPGDILFSRTSEDGASTELTHIGIAISATEVVHSAGYRWGVQRTPIERSGERGGNIVWEQQFGRPRCFRD